MTIESKPWAAGPLYLALVLALPAFVKDPFSEKPTLKVIQLGDAISISHQSIYTWLHAGRMSPRGARKIVEVANQPSNLAALTKLGREPIKAEDLAPFVIA